MVRWWRGDRLAKKCAPRGAALRVLAAAGCAMLALACGDGDATAGGRHHGDDRRDTFKDDDGRRDTGRGGGMPPASQPVGATPPGNASPTGATGSGSTGLGPAPQGAAGGEGSKQPVDGTRGGGVAPAPAAAEEPPATLIEAWRRLTAPGHPHHERHHHPGDHGAPKEQAAGDRDTVKGAPAPASATADRGVSAAPTTAQPATAPKIVPTRVYAAPAVPPLAAYNPREVLALDLPPDSVESLLHLGFTLGPASQNNLVGRSITPVVAPPGMDARAARKLLAAMLPDTTIAFNRVYRPPLYATAGQHPQAPAPPGQPAATAPCPSDRCYGAMAIGWRPQLASCARNITVGVIDTAIDRRHTAFAASRISEAQVLPPGAAQPGPQWHGTGILSVMAGASGGGTPGLIPDANFFVADIFFADAKGQAISDSHSLLQALDLMDRYHVPIINLSVAGGRDELVEQAVASLAAKGVVIIAAAGNGGPDAPPSYPAAYPQVIAVTAVNRERIGYRHANRGPYIDLAAPGVDIWTALPGDQEGPQTGTSFAVPFVTAIVAAIYAQAPQKSKAALLDLVTTTDLGAPGRDPIYGRGLVQAPASCKALPDAPAPPPAETARAQEKPPLQPAAFGFGPSGGR